MVAKNDHCRGSVGEVSRHGKTWGPMIRRLVPPDCRDEARSALPPQHEDRLARVSEAGALGDRAGEECALDGVVPCRGHAVRVGAARPWLTSAEHDGMVAFDDRHPLAGYRRLTHMLLDQPRWRKSDLG